MEKGMGQTLVNVKVNVSIYIYLFGAFVPKIKKCSLTLTKANQDHIKTLI